MTNYLDRKAQITVTKAVTGELLESSDEPEITRSRETLEAVNPTNVLKWSVTLGPGEKKAPTYKYKAYVR